MLTIKNRVGTLLVATLLAAGVFGVTGCKPPGVRALLSGKKLLEQGKVPDAVARLKSAALILRTNAVAWNYLGLAYQADGQATSAAQAYQTALKLDPDLAEVHYNLGCLWLEQNQPGAARNELAAYLRSQPRNASGWLKLGTAQLHSRDWTGAEQSYSAALNLDREQPEAWNGLGLIQLQRNHAAEAAKFFSAALQYQSNYPPALLNYAVVQQQYLGNRAAALEKYQEYAALKPTPPNQDAVVALIRVLGPEVAPAAPPPSAAPVTSAVPTIVSKPNTSSPPQIARGTTPPPGATSTANRQVNRPVTSPVNRPTPETRPAALPETTAATAPPVTPPQNNRATPESNVAGTSAPRKAWPEITPLPPLKSDSAPPPAESASANPPPAETTPAKATTPAQPKPFPRYTYHTIGKLEAGNRTTAETSLTKGLDAQYHNNLPAALTAFREAVRADPAYFKAYYNLAWTAYSLKEYPTALEAYEYALALEPNSTEARYSFALALKNANYPVDAVNELARLLNQQPDYTAGHLLLANLYAQDFGRPDLARPQYLKVLELSPQHAQAPQIRYWLADHPQ